MPIAWLPIAGRRLRPSLVAALIQPAFGYDDTGDAQRMAALLLR
ncbi:hypothetical protein [Mesorhizobium erdmanii]|nr:MULTISPECIES: hypothetical protein [Mesorhizobium]